MDTIEITPSARALLRKVLETGYYADPSELIEDVLGSREDETLLGYSSEALRLLGDEGEASGPGRSLTVDELRREVLRRAAFPRSDV